MIIPCKFVKVIKWLVKVMSGFMIIINDDDRAVLRVDRHDPVFRIVGRTKRKVVSMFFHDRWRVSKRCAVLVAHNYAIDTTIGSTVMAGPDHVAHVSFPDFEHQVEPGIFFFCALFLECITVF